MNIRRLTPSPTTLQENNTSFLVSLRPREIQEQILDSLRSNELPLVVLGQSMDFQLIQRLIGENASIKADLIRLSLMSYGSAKQSTRAAETLLNYLLSKLKDQDLLALKEIISTDIIDDGVITNLINLIRLTGISDPIKFIDILETSLNGTLCLRRFIGTLDSLDVESINNLQSLSTQPVPTEVIESINATEDKNMEEITKKVDEIQENHIQSIDNLARNAELQRILLSFGVSGLIWASFRFGFWDRPLSPESVESGNGLLNQLQVGLAGLTGFLLKRGLFRR